MPVRLEETMSYASCLRSNILKRSELAENYPKVIVYLKPCLRPNGRWTSPRGKFHVVYTNCIFWSSEIDDWNLTKDAYTNQHGVPVKQCYVEFAFDRVLFAADFFCRIKRHAPYQSIDTILTELNSHLDKYQDQFRRGIAQEWAAQEPWRVFPFENAQAELPGQLYPGEFNKAAVMRYLLPNGYGEDMPVED